MKIKNIITIFVFCILVLTMSFLVRRTYAVDTVLTSSNYLVKDNIIYVVPTSISIKAEEVLRNVESTEKITIKNGNTIIDKSDIVKTGYKFNSGSLNYDIVVLGDVNGDGTIKLADVSYLYNYFKSNATLNKLNVKASDTTNDNKIGLNDISRLYNYFKGSSAFTYYSDVDIESVNDYIKQAKDYLKNNPASKRIGTNIINELKVSNKTNSDQVVITKDGKVEVAILRNNFCYRKYANSDSLDIIEGKLCNANVTNFPSNGGQLHISGSKILDQNNNEVYLHGSTINAITSLTADNPSKEGQTNPESLKTLRNWGANIVRLFAPANNGYSPSFIGNEDQFTSQYKKLIDMVIESDMYIIVNWDGARNNNASFTDKAVDFFTRIASSYPNEPHIIYEIWNEPEDGNTWADVHNHANAIIPVIREYSPNSVVLVGTPGWDAGAINTSGHELNYSNIMYVYHSYMNYYRGNNVEKLVSEVERGVPIIVTEWGSMSVERNTRLVYDEFAESYAKILYNHKISNLLFTFSTSNDYDDPYGNKYGIVLTGKWENDLPNRILKINGHFMKSALSNNYQDFKTNQLRDNSNVNGRDYRSNEWKDKITSIEFKTALSVPSNAVKTWDLSLVQDGSIIGYLLSTNENDRYKMVICANGNINAPQMSNYLFAGMTNLKSIDFTGFTTNYTEYMSFMFYNDQSLTSIDLSSLRSDYIKTMISTFEGCTSLNIVNMSTFTTKPITNFDKTFYNCTSLTNVDMGNMSFSDSVTVVDTLKNVKNNCTFIVKDNTIKNKLSSTASGTINFTIKE